MSGANRHGDKSRNQNDSQSDTVSELHRILERADDVIQELVAIQSREASRNRLIKAGVYLHEAILALDVDKSDEESSSPATVTDIRSRSRGS